MGSFHKFSDFSTDFAAFLPFLQFCMKCNTCILVVKKSCGVPSHRFTAFETLRGVDVFFFASRSSRFFVFAHPPPTPASAPFPPSAPPRRRWRPAAPGRSSRTRRTRRRGGATPRSPTEPGRRSVPPCPCAPALPPRICGAGCEAWLSLIPPAPGKLSSDEPASRA